MRLMNSPLAMVKLMSLQGVETTALGIEKHLDVLYFDVFLLDSMMILFVFYRLTLRR